MNSFLFCSLFLGILLIPGYAICTFTQVKETAYKVLFSISYSYFVFTFLLFSQQVLKISWGALSALTLTIVLLSLVVVLKLYIFKELEPSNKQPSAQIYGFIGIILLSTIYHLVSGPYFEIPADLFAHLEKVKTALYFQSNEASPEISLSQFFRQRALVWYHLIALCAHASVTPIESVFFYTTLISKTLFLVSIYSFSLIIFKRQQYRVAISILATLFVATHLGVNVFSYIRYYSFAPTMLAYVVYLTTIVTFLQLIRTHLFSSFITLFLSIIAFIFTALTVHNQEALFILIILFAISLVISFQSILRNFLTTDYLLINSNSKILFISKSAPHVISILGLITFGIVYSYSQDHLTLSPNISWRLWEFNIHGFDIQVLNLKFQFIQTLTVWGVMVLFVSLFSAKHLKGNTFLIAGLITPLLTVLNPFFVDFFLRISSSPNLYRVLYIVPIHFSAALLIVKFTEVAYLKKNLLTSGRLFIYTFLSIALLLPINNGYMGLHYSRFTTLAKTDPSLTPDQFRDVIVELNNMQGKHRIYTDPITGYLISALTPHNAPLRKKFSGYRALNGILNNDNYDQKPLEKYKGGLILVNSRNHKVSKVGKLSGHWSENILNVKQFYSSDLLNHLHANPKRFKLLWESKHKDIHVYKISD